MSGLRLRYVAGHQDRKIPLHKLSLLARLNIEADALATKYQTEHGSHQPIVLLTEWAGVHLHLQSGTVTSHYETTLRFQATGPPLQAYMMKKYNWTIDTWKHINWRAHGLSIKKDILKRTHLIKYVHDVLPTNAKLHRRDPRRTTCPACRQGTETWVHIVRCSTDARQTWRAKTLTSIDARCNNLTTDPHLRNLLCNAVSNWMELETEDNTKFCVDPGDFPNAYRRLIMQQNRIGWEHIFQGRFSTDWSLLQDNFYANQLNHKPNQKRRTGHSWQVAIIRCVWSRWYLVWEMRNHDLHGADESSQAKANREEVERSLRVIYDVRALMEPSVQTLLCKDITSHFSRTTRYNQNWLAVYGPLVRSSIRRAKERAIQNVRPITDWLRKKYTT
jgi:hypothetical protein